VEARETGESGAKLSSTANVDSVSY